MERLTNRQTELDKTEDRWTLGKTERQEYDQIDRQKNM
jgi:hypothetical protein